jgi:cupin 2 domain-containing protein
VGKLRFIGARGSKGETVTQPTNLFDGVPRGAAEEIFTELIRHGGVRIERIVSTGQAPPPDAPYCQTHDEWVLLLSGSAGLWVEGEGECSLRPGDCLMIAAGRRHRVTWTASGEPTIWLAVHFPQNNRDITQNVPHTAPATDDGK